MADGDNARWEASARRAGSLSSRKNSTSSNRTPKKTSKLASVFHHRSSSNGSTVGQSETGRKPRPSVGAGAFDPAAKDFRAEGGPGGMEMGKDSRRGTGLSDEASVSGDSTSAFSGTTSTWEKVDATLDAAPLVRHHPTQDHEAPMNLLSHPLPPSDIARFSTHAMQQFTIHFIFLATVMCVLMRWGFNPFWAALVGGVGLFGLRRRVEGMRDEFGFDTERKRAREVREKSTTGESVEWMNALIEVIWPLVSTDILKAGVDLLEDTLQAQSPGVVNSVRVDDVDLGRNAMRLLSIKVLPSDQPIVEKQPTLPDEPGDYVNIECEFAYRRAPPPAPKSSNAHFISYFGVGFKKLANFEMPVWIQMEGLYGRIRLRLQLIADPPFVRHTTFTFPKLPTVEIAAKPMHGFNVMSLPLISNFVTHSIDIVLAGFVAPASYTLDLSRMLLGSDVMMKPRNTGVLAIAIHRAENLIASDINGSSDPYVSLSFSRFAKPLYATRIIERQLNPHWEEITFLRVSPDDAAESEKIRFTVWDSDRVSADDPLGKVEIGLLELTNNPGKVFNHTSTLEAYHPGYKTAGTLTYSIAYFTYLKSVPSQHFQDHLGFPRTNQGDRPLFTERQTEAEINESGISPAVQYSERMRAALDGKIPPSVDTRSGMLVVQVHQIANLEVPSTREHVGRHKKGEHLEHGSIPSSYAFILINDQKIYETRVKKHTTDPYINAGTERFIRDWPRTRVDIVVMDARMREKDAIIGVVSLPLAETLAKRSQVTRWYPLVGGVGYGRMRASILFKAIGIDIERPLRGWDVGTLEILKMSITGLTEETNGAVEFAIMSSGTIPRAVTETSASEPTLREGAYTTSYWAMHWVFKPRIRLPVVTRLQSSLTLLLKSSSGLMQRKDVEGAALTWLSTIVDGEVTTLDLALEPAVDGMRSQQCREEVHMPTLHPLATETHRRPGRPDASRQSSGLKEKGETSSKSKDKDVKEKKKEKVEKKEKEVHQAIEMAKEHSRDERERDKDREKQKMENKKDPNSAAPSPPISQVGGSAESPTIHRGDTLETLDAPSHISSQISDPEIAERIDPGPATGEQGADRPRLRITLRFVPGISQAHQSLTMDDQPLDDAYRTWRTTTMSKERVDGGLVKMMSQQAQRHGPGVAEEKILSKRRPTNAHIPGLATSGATTPKKFVKDSPGSSGQSPSSSRPNSRRSSIIIVRDGDAGEWTDDDNDWEDEGGGTGRKGGKSKRRWLGMKSPAQKESDVMFQRGTSQVKAVRTLAWMKDSAKHGVRKITKSRKHRGPTDGVEKEYISSIG